MPLLLSVLSGFLIPLKKIYLHPRGVQFFKSHGDSDLTTSKFERGPDSASPCYQARGDTKDIKKASVHLYQRRTPALTFWDSITN